MTTSILAQKLLSVKLDKGEFEKIKWLKYDNMEKKNKAVRALKAVISQTMNETCRLCLRPGRTNIFGNLNEYDFPKNIKSILGIEIFENDGKPQNICSSCTTTIKKAAELRQTAETTQWRLQQELEMVSESPEWDPPESVKHHGSYFVEQDKKIVREWTCSRCRKIFNNQNDFNDHGATECCSEKKCYVCEICGLELKTLTRLNRHRLTHTDELHFACACCPYRARTKYALIVHERSHTGDRPVTCPYCPATFPNSSNLASHKRRHFPPAYHCHLCQKGFKFKEALQNHLATQHSNAKPFICSMCGKPFPTRKMIRRHELKVHNRPKMRSGVLPSYLKQLDGSDS